MLVNTRAIVMSALKYGEADLIVAGYTQTSGLKSYMLKGILKSKRGKFRASMFQPLTQLEIVANHKDKGTLEYLKEVKVVNPYQSLHSNVVKSAMVMFLAEVLKSAIKEEEHNEALFSYLENTLNWLDLHDHIANFHLLFLLKLSRYLGFYPEETYKENPYFNLLEGTFEKVKANEYCVNGENLQILRSLLGINFDELNGIRLNQESRSDFLKMLILYYELHIEGFKKPKSLTVLNEIFS